MKKLLENKWTGAIFAVVGGLGVAALVWYAFGGREWYTVRTSIRNIASGNERGSIAQMEALNDRAYVLKKLEDAVETGDFPVEGKVNLLKALGWLNQHRAMKRALDSQDKNAQRAACSLLFMDGEMKPRCSEIALEWLKDEHGSGRSMAAMICGRLDLPDAQPAFLAIASGDPTTPEELALFRQALAALKDPKPPAMVERLFQLAAEGKDLDVRAIALETLQRMKDGPRDRILALSIATLSDPTANDLLRIKGALGLRDFPEERSWQALEAVLLSEKEQNRVLQRNCLYTLGMIALSEEDKSETHIDRLKQLLLDRRVYHSSYFGIRVDVAIALATLNVREGIALDIMCDYLVDEDDKDRGHIVRQEGWLTLWALTGVQFENTPELSLFRRPPQAFQNPKAAREYLFSRNRPGLTTEQSAAVARLATNLGKLQEIRQIFTAKKGAILSEWKTQAEAAEAAKAGKKETPPGPQGPTPPGKETPVGPQGPVPPGKEEGSGDKPKEGSEGKEEEGSEGPDKKDEERPDKEGDGSGDDADEKGAVQKAIGEIAGGNPKSLRQLEDMNDRALVLKALESAVQTGAFTVEGKADLLRALVSLEEKSAVTRALDSPDKSARRAACSLLFMDEGMKPRCSEIALEWLKDENGSNRATAAMICGRLEIQDAQPVFLAIASGDPTTPDELALFRQALAALKDPKPPAMVERLFELAAEGKDLEVRSIALEALQRMKDGPRDRVVTLSIAILSDPAADDAFRMKAALGLRDSPDERAWQALEAVLLSDKEPNRVLQRNCLYTLGMIALSEEDKSETHIDRLKQLLLDRRVYHSSYFGIRVDVAIALATLNVREGIALDIMCDYLVDEDDKDKDHIVRQEAWLTLWVLTGVRFEGIPELAGFEHPPAPFREPKAAREYLFSRHRHGITSAQSASVAKLVANLPQMKEIRQVFAAKKDAILKSWKAEADEAATAKKG